MSRRGKLIVLEGVDGAGTSTHAKLLTKNLRFAGYMVEEESQPGSALLEPMIRMILRKEVEVDPKTLALLFAADRIEHYRHRIERVVSKGVHVICDRYVYSAYAYQSLDNPIEWVMSINEGTPPADYTLLLEVDREEGARRRSRRGQPEMFEETETLEKVAANYRKVCEGCVGRFDIIDSGREKMDVAEELFTKVATYLNGRL